MRLADAGDEVVCIDTADISTSPLLAPYLRRRAIRYICHDIEKSFVISGEQIYNLASPTFITRIGTHPLKILRTNIMGSINALETARRNGATVLFASSGDIYGGTGQQPFVEKDIFAGRITPYAESKRAAEALHYAYAKEHGCRCRIARIFSTYGTGGRIGDQRIVMRLVVEALLGRDILISGSGEQLRVHSAGSATWPMPSLRLMNIPDTEATATVNLGSSVEMPINRLADMIVSLTGSRSRIVHIPARSDDPRRMAPDLTRARNMLDWRASTSIEDGLRMTIGYVQSVLHSLTRDNAAEWIETL
ncbi:MAG: GDP-mannose 4,6-dehydratase [Bacteroidales bacterium]|nr:MAG: GDP-mannose 4,6-dehydratase [Bacteroidales bacterium]